MSAGPLDRGTLRARLRAGETTVGTFVGLASQTAVEVCAAAGADWVLVDLEHGAGTESVVGPAVLAAASYGVPTLVRVESAERIRIGRALDQGAAGVMLPRLNSYQEASDALVHLHYPPYGDRGVATYNRACRWGMDASPLAADQQETLGIVQVETLSALEDVDALASLESVDVLFVGPLDLSAALGVPRQFNSPLYREALQKVLAAAERHGKAAGILALDGSAAANYVEEGFRFVAIGSDSTLLAAALRQSFDKARTSNLEDPRKALA
ncbi:2,4-dihydroxyhept-2-ene-1,7-dioic acid aldolase [Arthrobacter sp. 9AX]|uniref:HpcH/HpaI aldolase family protein n=1 Tax=Arthrobacter sp. 9AX TaxID=2653131 RepID=UPI0012EF42E4|nr:aldolase/citrate lyase family protein [Arthrobacter sp. 9AX]VXB04902.1 2,4-dihydroxyhept-2-ene-1,7-dioic acid aldolase [Arthrobacter sp. 9AX]